MAIVNGTAYWASVTTPNTNYEPVYTVNLVVDDEIADSFKSKGFKLKQMDEGLALVIKRKVDGPNGQTRPAPKLYDSSKNEIDVQVGNGSTVKVQYREWETDNKYGQFKGLDFQAMQVIDLIESGSPDGSELESDNETNNLEDEL